MLLANVNSSVNLSGTVYYNNSGQPVASAKVFVRELNKSMQADINGRYSIDLSQGDYTLIASTDEISGFPKTVSVDKTKEVDLTIDTMVTRFDDVLIEDSK